jgi:hypothetical protein
MNLIDRIQLYRMLRRADNIIRNADLGKARRERINRPHVQSDHLISYPVPKAKPVKHRADYGIGPFYAACVICLVGPVAYVNAYHRDPGAMYACNQVATR